MATLSPVCFSDLSEKMEEFTADIFDNLPNEWREFIGDELNKNYWQLLFQKLNSQTENIFPIKSDIFRAFNLVKPNDVKLVIIGQDPYIHKDEAIGVAFGINETAKVPPSLNNIFKEIRNEYNVPEDHVFDKTLTYIAEQGVLLLNTILTVNEGKSNSHKDFGWERFTKYIISRLNETTNCVFLALGRQAEKFIEGIDESRVVIAGHPSPLNRSGNFLNSSVFMLVNSVLEDNGFVPINWA